MSQAHTGNAAYGVGGTAKDGGLSTAGTVADGGPNASQGNDPDYVPPPGTMGPGHEGNPIYGVGGTAKDGGISTGATVSDGGPNDPQPDPTYKP